MEQQDIVSSLISTLGNFIEHRLCDGVERLRHKEQCSERLAAESVKDNEVHYSDQAVLANLDWGMDAIEEAINTSNTETKTARLEYAEKMLQVCAMLNSTQKTAGVPNFYLSAWAHLNLAYLSKLRNDPRTAVVLIMDMFIIDPFFSRVDFAPELWRSIFLPHMGAIVGWYSDERRRILMDVIPDTSEVSLTVDFFDESLIMSVRPEQTQRIRDLEEVYGESLDENTRMYAKYYKDCVNCDSTKMIPMLPIIQAPMTPLTGGSAVPDYVKFGPVLPKSAGFSPRRNNSNTNYRLKAAENLEDSVEEEMSEDSGGTYVERNDENVFSRRNSPHNSCSPMDSPRTPCSRNSSPRSSGKMQKSSMLRLLSARSNSPLVCNDHSTITSPDSDGELMGQLKNSRKSVHHARSSLQVIPMSSVKEGDDGSECYICSPTSEAMTPKSRAPKDFVCPITGQIFIDPVTLETGQTYERKAIQEWMSRGNTTCPITRQPLSAHLLPKTNYILKRLITSWKDEYSCNESPRITTAGDVSTTSPTTVILETVINDLKPCIFCLCNSQDLEECETSITQIANILAESKVGPAVHPYLSSPTVINAFVEILSASLNKEVLITTIHILSNLICSDVRVADLISSTDSEFYCLSDLLKKGLPEAAILMYLLKPSFSQLSSNNLIPTLVHIISNKSDQDQCHAVAPKDAAIALLEQIVGGGDESERKRNAMSVVKENGLAGLLRCINRAEGRIGVVSILLSCIKSDVGCRSSVANRIELSPVLELFHGGNDSARGICLEFLCHLVQLSRRRLSNKILQSIKEEGTCSTMHTLLVYLQMSPMEQKPAIAALLLQLDLLVSPRKMSIYREEAIEALIEALERKEFPSSQVMALDTLSSLSGHSTKSYMECWLLKLAGFDQPYNALITAKEEDIPFADMKEEEKAARGWEKRMAFVLSNHEKGMIFKALGECLKSNSIEIAKSSLVVATWLSHMLYTFPDCGVRVVARKVLLPKLVNVLQSSKNLEEKILATFALRGFVSEPDGASEMAGFAKSIWKTLRRLNKSCKVVPEIMKQLINFASLDAAELWSCVEAPEVDVSMNGEIVTMLLHPRNRLITAHSDGTIKLWDTAKRAPRIIQEARQHSKAVTCLYVSEKLLYTASLDKTIRVWSMKQEEIHCIQVHDVKEPVLALAANPNFACFSSQANGVKVYNWSGVPKNINFNKQVKCLALNADKLYCGCSGYSVQEVDLRTHTSSTFYSGAKKILGKQTIYSLQLQDGLLYACGSSVDGIAGKVFKVSSKAVVGCFSTGLDIQQTAINNEFIFTASKCGIIEVWLRDKVTKIAYIRINGAAKMASLGSDPDGHKLFAGTSDGKLQIWSLE